MNGVKKQFVNRFGYDIYCNMVLLKVQEGFTDYWVDNFLFSDKKTHKLRHRLIESVFWKNWTIEACSQVLGKFEDRHSLIEFINDNSDFYGFHFKGDKIIFNNQGAVYNYEEATTY